MLPDVEIRYIQHELSEHSFQVPYSYENPKMYSLPSEMPALIWLTGKRMEYLGAGDTEGWYGEKGMECIKISPFYSSCQRIFTLPLRDTCIRGNYTGFRRLCLKNKWYHIILFRKDVISWHSDFYIDKCDKTR